MTVHCAFGRVDITAPTVVDRAVFTDRERWRVAGRAAQHAAGLLAAKHAVAGLLGVTGIDRNLRGIEIVPQPSANCRQSAACRDGHPPAVLLDPELQRRAAELGLGTAQLSISHTAGLAVAVAMAVAAGSDSPAAGTDIDTDRAGVTP